MKKTISFLIAIIPLLSCEDDVCLIGDGNVQSYDLEMSSFNAVSLFGPIDLQITQGNTQAVTVRAENQMYRELTHRVKNNTLEIGFEGNVSCFETDHGVWIDIVVPDITKVSISGISTIKSSGDLNLDQFDIDIEGTAHVAIIGQADSQNINVSGTLDMEAFNFISQTTSIDVEGSVTMEINCVKALNVDVEGSATIKYKGSPQISQSVSGSLDLIESN